MNSKIINKMEGGLIVSCQSEGNDPFNSPDFVVAFAEAAHMGGAIGIRSEGIAKIQAIKDHIDLPLIGLIKSKFEDGSVRITGSLADFQELYRVGCDIISIDGTFRSRDSFESGAEFIRSMKCKYNCLIMADISTYEEAIACADAGADCISTTLQGYTPETYTNINYPDFELLEKLATNLSLPIFAEGRINTPSLALEALKRGAWAVVVGSAISRPRIITSWFVKEMNNKGKE